MVARNGRCLCGRIEVGLAVDPLMVGLCHCRDCQTAGGTAFSAIGFLPADSVRVSGEPRTVIVRSAGGSEVRRAFCGDCGTPVTTRTDAVDEQGLIIVKLGLFDDLSAMPPSLEVFCDRRVSWLPELTGTTNFAAMPPQ